MHSQSFSSGGNRSHASRSRGSSSRPTSAHAGGFSRSTSMRGPSTVGGSYSSSRGPSRGGSGSRSSGGYSGYGMGRRGSRGVGGRTRGRSMGQYIDPARFINKAVITEESEVFKPEHAFADFAIDERVKKSIAARGYEFPTPIQDRAIPHVLKGEDIVGIANTGTGKTGAFLIPLLDKIVKNPKEQVMVIVPTRELAIQIEDELKQLTVGMNIYSVCCVGGASMSKQIYQLRYQYNFIIGTPGRLKDHINHKHIHLKEFNTVVLDEADRMLDMGFIADMRAIMAGMSKERHTLFFSATLSPDIEKLIHEFLKNPVKISVKTGDTAKNVDQDVVRVGQSQNKIDVLHDMLRQAEFSKVIIFGRTKHGVEKLANELVRKGVAAESIHGNKNHTKRQKALHAFKSNKINVLVATDVAARGLDIPNVSHVINFDIPATYEDYVHRIGRTGRGDKMGKALTFLG